MTRRLDRRDVLVGLATTATVGLAGCSYPDDRDDALDRAADTTNWLRPGESFGDRNDGDEVWKVSLDAIHDDRRIDLSIEQIVLDEVGQDKEGIDPTYTYERTAVPLGSAEVIQDNWGFGYLDHRDGEALIGIDDFISSNEINRFVETFGPEWYDE